MKKSFYFLFSLLALISCGDDGGDSVATSGSEFLNVTDLEIAGGNTTTTLVVQASDKCEWVVSSGDEWIRGINPTKGRGTQNVTITVSVNPSSSAERTAIITVKTTSGSITRNITITQSPNTESLELSMEAMNFTYSASSQSVSISSNTHWTVSGTADWLSINKKEGDNDGTLVVSVDENTTETERNAVLSFKGSGGLEKQLLVKQAGHPTDFTVSPTSIIAPALSSTIQFNIAGDARWSIQSNSQWAMPSASDMSGEGSKAISITLPDNTAEASRTAEVIVSSSSKSEKVLITQTAATKAVVSNFRIANITRTSADLSFSFTSMFPVTEYGVCYSSSANPTTSNEHVTEVTSGTQGSFITSLDGLTSGQTYHVRAYAKSVVGIAYSDDVTFTLAQGEKPNSGDNSQPGW